MLEGLEEVADQIEAELEEKDTIREIALKSSRAIVRLSTAVVRSIHRCEDPENLIEELRDEASRLKGLLDEHKDLLYAGYTENCQQEYTEAVLFYVVVNDMNIPSHKELGVTPQAYILGLADLIGELRRLVLDNIRKGTLDDASKYLDEMETIFDVIMRYDYPKGFVPIRKKQDVARALIEKTRGELAVGIRTQRLEQKLEELQDKL